MTQRDLFIFDDLPVQSVELIELEGGELLWVRHFLSPTEASKLFEYLMETTNWRQDSINIAGKSIPIPRLQAWIGDAAYTYSGLTLEPTPWPAQLLQLKSDLEEYCDCQFNSLLINLYRDESDSVGWHADNEEELGKNPTIASVSLGAPRAFELKQKHASKQKLSLTLNSGDLLIMKNEVQENWLHQVPKQKPPSEPRINLTFRRIIHETTVK